MLDEGSHTTVCVACSSRIHKHRKDVALPIKELQMHIGRRRIEALGSGARVWEELHKVRVGGISHWMCGFVCNVDNFIAQDLVVTDHNVERWEATKTACQGGRAERVTQLSICSIELDLGCNFDWRCPIGLRHKYRACVPRDVVHMAFTSWLPAAAAHKRL